MRQYRSKLHNDLAWLATWEPPFHGGSYIPAVNAVGYPKPRPDFSKAPQINWWMNEKKTPVDRTGVGIGSLRAINLRIVYRITKIRNFVKRQEDKYVGSNWY